MLWQKNVSSHKMLENSPTNIIANFFHKNCKKKVKYFFINTSVLY